jgi:hypothetical protein
VKKAVPENVAGRVIWLTGRTHFLGSFWLILILLALLLTACASTSGQNLPGLNNYGVVDPGKVLRSAQPTNWQTVRGQGVKTVINLRDDFSEWTEVRDAGMVPYAFPMDEMNPPSVESMEQVIRDIVSNPLSQPVLLH